MLSYVQLNCYSSILECANFERSVSIDHSIETAKKFLHEHGFKLNLRRIGDVLKTTLCEITNDKGELSDGSGKGIGLQSIASAIFESIEHFYSARVPLDMPVLKLDFNNHDSFLDKGSPDFQLIVGNRDIYLSRVIFKELGDNSKTYYYPYFLCNPYFKPSDSREIQALCSTSLHSYATNSGIAAGLDKYDAILHGLLEVIERDAIGIELLRTVVSKRPQPLRRICYDKLSNKIRLIISLIKKNKNIEIRLWDITTDLGIPVVLANISFNDHTQFFGSGASLCMDYAIERAILEAQQLVHASELGYLEKQLTLLQKSPMLSYYESCFLRRGIFKYRGNETYSDYESVNDFKNISQVCPKNQVDIIQDKLLNQGIHIYNRTIMSDVINIEHVAVPKLELFSLASYGVKVLPGFRGNQLLAQLEQ